MLSQHEIDQLADALADRLHEKLSVDLSPGESLLDIQTVAKLLRCSVATIERRTRTGDLPSVKIGRLRRYRRSDLVPPRSPEVR